MYLNGITYMPYSRHWTLYLWGNSFLSLQFPIGAELILLSFVACVSKVAFYSPPAENSLGTPAKAAQPQWLQPGAWWLAWPLLPAPQNLFKNRIADPRDLIFEKETAKAKNCANDKRTAIISQSVKNFTIFYHIPSCFVIF